MGSRLGEMADVERILGQELERFMARERSSAAAPIAAALVGRADRIRDEELQRMKSHLDAMTPEQRAAVEALGRRIASRLMHTPLEKTRALGETAQGSAYLEALRELFDLDE
jgi:glutamyl-tRNA reductase